MYQYMRTYTSDEWGIKKLQDKILEIAVYVDKLCQENDIEYFLMGGSALGAIRHNGFIPWDDDLDFFMTPDNYEKFVKVFAEKGNKDKFFLEPFGVFDNMVTLGKVRFKNTTYIEESIKKFDISHNIYLDIFILHTAPNSTVKRKWQYFWAKYIVVKGQSIKDISRYGFALRCLLRFTRVFPKRMLVKYALKQVYKYRNENSEYLCNYLGKAKFKAGTYKREWFAKTKRISFETVELNAPIKVEDFLSERFGDYMRIPDIDKIRREQHACLWDAEKDYKEYIDISPTMARKYLF